MMIYNGLQILFRLCFPKRFIDEPMQFGISRVHLSDPNPLTVCTCVSSLVVQALSSKYYKVNRKDQSPLDQYMEWCTRSHAVTVRKVHQLDVKITKPLADRVHKNLVRCEILIHSAQLEHAVVPCHVDSCRHF